MATPTPEPPSTLSDVTRWLARIFRILVVIQVLMVFLLLRSCFIR